MFKDIIACPLLCNIENPIRDTQDHMLSCPKLNIAGTDHLSINQDFENIINQETIAKENCKLIRKRTTMLDTLENTDEDMEVPNPDDFFWILFKNV